MGTRIAPLPCFEVGEETPRKSEIRELRSLDPMPVVGVGELLETLRHPFAPLLRSEEALDAFDPFPPIPQFEHERADEHLAFPPLPTLEFDDDPTLPRAYSILLDGVAERFLSQCAWSVARVNTGELRWLASEDEQEDAFPLVSTVRRPA